MVNMYVWLMRNAYLDKEVGSCDYLTFIRHGGQLREGRAHLFFKVGFYLKKTTSSSFSIEINLHI